jgi:exosortase C (VPDSG-CTERM-specific)
VETSKLGFLASSIAVRAAMWTTWRELPKPKRERLGGYAFFVLSGAILFSRSLTDLLRHAAEFPLHSHTPLVPLFAGYLLYIKRGSLAPAYGTSLGGTALLATVSVGAMAAGWWWRQSLSVSDYLAWMMLSFVSLVAAGGFLFLGAKWMASATFPFFFLIFMIPMPDAMANALEIASMQASADVSAWFLIMTGTPLLRDGQVFALPGIVLEVAQECSGIRSSWVLFITSLVASHVFLRSPWSRAALVAFVLPLGIVRNGFRIMTIGLLCVHVGPHMIDSPIHHQGGPLFFALSMGPFFLALLGLRRLER